MLGRMFTLPTRQNHLVYTDKLRQVRERERDGERERDRVREGVHSMYFSYLK